MIDPDEPKTICFKPTDQPVLPEIEQEAIERKNEAERRRKEETHRWLEQNMGFQPFGGEW